MNISFFSLEPWAKEHTQSSAMLKGHELSFFNDILTKDTVPELTNQDVISVFVDSLVDSQVLARFPNLKLIATRSTGFDHIDMQECKKRDIAVASVPTYGENTVAEFTFALILALSKKIFESYHRIKEEGKFDLAGLRGFDLKGKTLGVVGTGRIGKHVITIAKGFDMHVVASDVMEDTKSAKELGFQYLPLEELLAVSDIVTLHVPYMKETHYLINKDNIAKMKQGAYIINTSRGGVIETEALVAAIKEGRLTGAGLDVLEEEGAIKDELDLLVSGKTGEHNMKTILANHVLIDMPNVIITPHNAFNTREALERILRTTIENIQGFAKGKPLNLVNG